MPNMRGEESLTGLERGPSGPTVGETWESGPFCRRKFVESGLFQLVTPNSIEPSYSPNLQLIFVAEDNKL